MSKTFQEVSSNEMTQVQGGISCWNTVQALQFARAFGLNRMQTSLLVNYNKLIAEDPHKLVDPKIGGIDTDPSTVFGS